MHTSSISLETGLYVADLRGNAEFSRRQPHVHDIPQQMAGLRRIANTFVEAPETTLQELVQAAVELCGADSAGISIEKEDRTEATFYEWVATAGEYSAFTHAVLPRNPSACGICLERAAPQHFRVSQPFFDLMGIEAPLVTDGILLPWRTDGIRGTIFIMAHGRTEAFDQEDSSLMTILADFAAMGVRQQRQRQALLQQASATAAAAMANELAHKINNPLQSLTNIMFLVEEGGAGEGAKELREQASADLRRLSALVSELLALPYRNVESINR